MHMKKEVVSFPEEVLEHVLTFVTSHKDRNAVSLVCKWWYRAEALTRECVFVGNCYAICPNAVTHRFKNLKSLILKGKPRFSDFGLVPPNWGGFADPWVSGLVLAYPWFEELRLKRMVISDSCLALLARSFPCFRTLVLTSCEGFSTGGLAPIAANCRYLQVLELQECEVDETGGEWLSSFPDSYTSLVSLNFGCTSSEVDFPSLEKLISRCSSLRSLMLNDAVSFEQVVRLLCKAPQLVDLGTGSFFAREAFCCRRFEKALSYCKRLRSLSGFWGVASVCLPSLFSVCKNLTSLNLSYASSMRSVEMITLVSYCHNLQRLWVLASVGDSGLEAVALSCKGLEELRVFPSTDDEGLLQSSASEEGLVAISAGCQKLQSILYFCGRMTNVGLEFVAKTSPQLTCFRLCILDPNMPDHITKEPLDEGFGAIAKCCTNLTRFSLSGLLTDKAFGYIGMYGKQVEMLSLAFSGGSNLGMQKIMEGCSRLRKLEIRDCPFGDGAILSNLSKYESMRSLWMSSCQVTVQGATKLAKSMPSLNVEVIMHEDNAKSSLVDKLYVYRTVAGKRGDAPPFVHLC
ncbi:hypothetical protein L7F22_058907 [Adiantum nelumboides]|nr:hypothetical protein [Adiantum nelumboides]